MSVRSTRCAPRALEGARRRRTASISPRTIISASRNRASWRTRSQRRIARGVPVGAGGSRLLRGNHPEHEALEAEAARFFGARDGAVFRRRLHRQLRR